MSDLNDKYRERWNDRRKKAYNWNKVIIMLLVLVALFIMINKLNTCQMEPVKATVEVIQSDSTKQADSTSQTAVPTTEKENK